MEIAILNYSLVRPTVELYTIPDEVEDVEDYLETEMDYKLSNCSWMCGDKIEIYDCRED